MADLDRLLVGTSNNCHRSSGTSNLLANDSALFSFRKVLDAPCNLLSRLTHFVFASHGTHFNFCHQNECYGSQILQKRPFRNLLVGMPKHCLGNPQIFISHRSQKSLINPLNRFTFPAGVEYYARFDSVLFTPKMSAIASYGNFSRSLVLKSLVLANFRYKFEA